jgi:hypothetical protein
MVVTLSTPVGEWRYGLHPRAAGLRLQAWERVRVRLGEALRLEFVEGDASEDGTIHVQYYIATDAGPWALWLSCARSELDDQETLLRELAPQPTDG